MPRAASGPPSPVTVDVVDDALFIGAALSTLAGVPGSRLKIQRIEQGWIPYIASFDDAADVVILRDELGDHVPTVLKVRALARIKARPIVVADEMSDARRWRLVDEGAFVVLDRRTSVQELSAFLVGRQPPPQVERPAGCVASRLSDRELQVSSLYAGRAAPSSTVLAQLLGIPVASVRTHLQRARTALRPGGSTSSRAELVSVMREQGWILASPRRSANP
ncbi:MAG TPA: hypothetical protein PKE40_02280 [Arachnia sp.]|nr:hypothetical protein [Arachnia sp.]HMT85157.1 hypothetical protein [Arachnia sp.]